MITILALVAASALLAVGTVALRVQLRIAHAREDARADAEIAEWAKYHAMLMESDFSPRIAT